MNRKIQQYLLTRKTNEFERSCSVPYETESIEKNPSALVCKEACSYCESTDLDEAWFSQNWFLKVPRKIWRKKFGKNFQMFSGTWANDFWLVCLRLTSTCPGAMCPKTFKKNFEILFLEPWSKIVFFAVVVKSAFCCQEEFLSEKHFAVNFEKLLAFLGFGRKIRPLLSTSKSTCPNEHLELVVSEKLKTYNFVQLWQKSFFTGFVNFAFYMSKGSF